MVDRRIQPKQITDLDAGDTRPPVAVTQMVITCANAAKIPLQVQAAASQTAHLTDWKTSGGSVGAYVDKDFNASFAGLTVTTTLALPNNSVTNAMLAQGAANTLKGNWTGSTANETDNSVGTNTVVGRVAGNIVAAQLVGSQVATGTITYGLIQAASAACILAATTGGSAFGEVTLDASLEFSGTTIRRAAFSGGDVTGSAGSAVLSIGANRVTLAMLATQAANTVLANATAGTAVPTAFSVGTNTVLGRVAGNIVAAQLVGAQVASGTITYGLIQTETKSTLLGNPTGSNAAPSEVSLGASLAFSGTALQRAAFTGDVTASQDSNALTIASAAVTYAKFQNVAALAVVGRSANSSGVSAAISATAASNTVLRESGSTLVFDTISTVAGNRWVLPFSWTGSGSQTPAIGFNVDGQNMDSPQRPMPRCKLVLMTINIHHTTGSSPGNWLITCANATGSTNTSFNASTTNLSNGDNVTVSGALSLTFAQGDLMRIYVNSGGALTNPAVAGLMVFEVY